LVPFIPKDTVYDTGCFTFLNRDYCFGSPESIDWEFSAYGKLWVYNLNYFDFLLQGIMTREAGVTIVESFMAGLDSESVGLEPYPVSLRGVNWIKFITAHQLKRDDINSSLYAQYLILARNIEYHLLGNHLLENACSLLYGAFFFKEKRWFDKSRALLARELNEQILQDGGHFELSPMYHKILLDRLLDCINLVQHNDCFGGQSELLTLLVEKAGAMIGWLKTMTLSDGSVPNLNDSTEGIAPATSQLFDYAERLGIAFERDKPDRLSDSGYRKFSNARYECVVDVGRIGPRYIPGHAHADTLNFVLNVDGRPFLVDTGISTYEKNSRQDEERSTKAHNTVVMHGANSSDVWGGFRVGRRAAVNILVDRGDVVSAQHDGYKSIGAIHKRTWAFHEGKLAVTDSVSGRDEEVEACLHFDHVLNPCLTGETIVLDSADIIFEGAVNIEIKTSLQALGFNRMVEAKCAVVTFKKSLVTTIVCKK